MIVPPKRCFDPTHRSYSGDRGFDECTWRDHQFRTGQAKRKSNPRMAVGQIVDRTICEILDGHPPLVPYVARDVWEDEGLGEVDFDESVSKAIRLVELWANEVWPAWPQVYATQHELHWEHAGATYHAHLDIVFTDGSLIDLKTSGRRLEAHRADTDEQLTWYAWGMREVYGTEPGQPVALDGLIDASPPADVKAWRPKAKRPWWDHQESKRGPVEIDALAEATVRRATVRDWMDGNGLHLTNGRSVAFACGDCPVRPICPAWRGVDLQELEDADAL